MPLTSYAHLYDTTAWQRLRVATFQRDSLTCQTCKLVCVGAPGTPASPVCDHITPHRGDALLFHDAENLQTLCKACHDGDKRLTELRGYSARRNADGWPLDPRHPANATA